MRFQDQASGYVLPRWNKHFAPLVGCVVQRLLNGHRIGSLPVTDCAEVTNRNARWRGIHTDNTTHQKGNKKQNQHHNGRVRYICVFSRVVVKEC